MIDESQCFKFEEIQKFNSPVYHLKIASDIVIAVTKNILIRFNIKRPQNIEEIKITQDDDLAHNIFIDPTGNHTIVCMQSGQSYYLSKSSSRFKYLKEAKGLEMEAVGWNLKQTTETSTSNILIGTLKGDIYETKLTSSASVAEQSWIKVHMLEQAITGIFFDSYPNSNMSKYFVIVTTPTSIYPFYFKEVQKTSQPFQNAFQLLNQLGGGTKCTTFPYDFGYSVLDVFYDTEKQFPKFISWMNGAGIYWAKLNRAVTEVDANILLKPRLFNSSVTKPRNIISTKFHILLQDAKSINIYRIINEEVIYSVNSDVLGTEKFYGLCKDHAKQSIYLFTNLKLYRINCNTETRNLWLTYLKLGNYDKARKYCKNAEEEMKINMKHAECLFKEENYNKAGEYYALTSLPFEEVTLKFIDLENKDGLTSYLLTYACKHNNGTTLGQNSFDVVCMWLLELFFEKLNTLHFQTGEDISCQTFKESDEKFKKFMECPEIKKSLKRNKELIYQKIKNYGDFYQSAIFAEIVEDNVKLIECHIEKGNYEVALKMLKNEKAPKCHYIFGKTMITKYPDDLVDIWIKLSSHLDPKKILPFLRSTKDEIAFKYVKHMISNSRFRHGVNSQSVIEELHNFFILLCVKLANPKSGPLYTNELMTYLQKEGLNHLQTNYDPQLALRICLEWEHLEGSVFLFCLLQKHKEAVELSLQKQNLELAQEVAVKFTGSDEVKKNLWLQIAKFIINEKKNIEEVCLLVRSQSSLKLEDVLPFFPDSVKIDEFSAAICDSLHYYNDHNENLKKDMKLATEYALKTREEIKYLKQRPIRVSKDSKCAYCQELLTLRPFCLFPCQHFFHMYCLEELTTPMLNRQGDPDSMETLKKVSQGFMDDSQVKNEFCKLLTTDCSYCGKISVNIIDKPIISYAEFNEEMDKWM